MSSPLETTVRPGPMADTVDTLASRWVLHRTRAGLIKGKTGRNQLGNLDYFRAAHGANRTLRADRKVFDRWLESIGHLAASSRRLHVSTVRGFISWAAAEGQIAPRALKLIPKVRVPRALPRAFNSDQMSRLMHSLDTDKKRVIIGLMAWCGLRCAEVAGLRVEDINEREATMHITGKGGNERMVPIPPEFAPHLTRWLDQRRRVPGPLIVSTLSGPYTANTISALVVRWMRTSGVKVSARDGRSAHALRHTAASDISDGGAPLTAVQALLGHQHLSSTAIYLRRTRLEDLRTAMTGRDYQ